MGVGKFSRT